MKRFVILGTAVIVVVALWSGAWLFFAGQIKSNIELMAEADGVTTPRFTCETLSVGGYPFHFNVACTEARLVNGDVLVDIAELRASALAYQPTSILAAAMGPVKIVDAFTGSQSSVAFSSLEASTRLTGWRIARISVVGKDVVWTDTLMGETLLAQSSDVEVHLLDIPEQHNAERATAALAGYIKADALDYPGMTIAQGNGEVEIEVSGLPDDIRNLGAIDAVQRWQAEGGKLKVVSVRGTDTTSTLNAAGELALDAVGQVQGKITIDSTGVAERIGPMLAEPYRTLVLGQPKPDGTFANELNFRDGGIYSGLIPIAAIPPLY